MNQTLSTRQLRLVALLGLVVLVAGAYWVLVARNNTTTSPTTSPTTARSTPAATTPAPTKPKTHTATPAKLQTHGLPVAVVLALRKHSVVVVSLSSPHAVIDPVATAEAKAGAAAMGAGFVRLDVFRQHTGTAVLRKLGVLTTPGVLVVRRPYAVFADFTGFVDRNVVEQAVADAR
jgi:hypothetical protein